MTTRGSYRSGTNSGAHREGEDSMRIVQRVILKLLGLLVLIGSAVLVAMWLNEGVYRYMLDYGRAVFHTHYCVGAAVILFLLALLGLLPLSRERRPKSTICFPGIHGNVTIELDSVEANLSRVVSKMPEVKKIKVKVSPSEDNHRAVVSADVLMYKGTGSASARDTANRIGDFLMDAAVNILGVEEVTKVDLNVRDIIIDAKSLSAGHVRGPFAKHEEPPVAAILEPAADREVPRSPTGLELGAHTLEPQQKEIGDNESGFSSPIEMIPAEPHETAPSEKTLGLAEEETAVGNTGFEGLATEGDEDVRKESDSDQKPWER